jgi:hypothetical protein
MMFEYIKSGEKILDIGVGTGLSATAFHTMGLDVFGLDYSHEMLKIREQKGLAVDLKQFDLNDSPLPYPNDLCECPIVDKPPGKNGLITFKHSQKYILDLLKDNKFSLLKELEFIAKNFQMEGKLVSFTLYIAEA